jgi:hypothetical protein
MEKLENEPSLNEIAKAEVSSIESSELHSTSEATRLKKIKPRAIIFKANDRDFCKIKDLIKAQFVEVEVVYVTTGPVASFLRVIKSVPFELQNSCEQLNYTIE